MKGDVRVWQLTSHGERERENDREREREIEREESKVMRSLFWPLPQGLLICVVGMYSGIQRPTLFVYVGTPSVHVCVFARACWMSLTISGVKSHSLILQCLTNDRKLDTTR